MTVQRPKPVRLGLDRSKLSGWWRALDDTERFDARCVVDRLAEWSPASATRYRGIEDEIHELMQIASTSYATLDWITVDGLIGAHFEPELWIELPDERESTLRVSVLANTELDGRYYWFHWSRWVEPECLVPETPIRPGVLLWLAAIANEALSAINAEIAREDELAAFRQWEASECREGLYGAAEAVNAASGAVRRLNRDGTAAMYADLADELLDVERRLLGK